LGAQTKEAILLDLPDFDVTDRDQVHKVLEKLRPEAIVHGAAYTAVDAAEADPDAAWAVNAEGTRAVAEAAEELGARLVYLSTDYVFSGDCTRPYTEDDPPAPLSVYGATKLAGERFAAEVEGHLILRTSWVFGEGKNFIRAILRAAAGRPGRQLDVVDDQRGRPTFAVDLAAGILRLLEGQAAGTFHLQGGGEPATWADVAEAALAAAGIDAGVRRVSTAAYDAGRPGPVARRPANGVLDCSRAAALGVTLRPWREAVEDYVRLTA
jgi:dTDP-4-dehydrorhamnose reductase